MSDVVLSEAFRFTLDDGDVVWPCTVSGTYRLSDGGRGHNVLGEGEHACSEPEMIQGALVDGRASRFRSKTNPSRSKVANHFSCSSPSIVGIHVNVGGVYVRLR
jgi:hypothetical protein